jgi:hypothetical protein
VLIANTLYGAVLVATFGFVNPEKDANTSDPHVSDERINRTAFVDACPVVVHASCRSQLIVNVQSVVWAFGPCSVNIPTVNVYFATSAPGECDQHIVYPPNGVPAVAVPSPYTRYGVDAVACVAEKPVMLANGASATGSPHVSDDAMSLILLLAASPTPPICSVHPAVRVHCVVPTNAPFIVNIPTI